MVWKPEGRNKAQTIPSIDPSPILKSLNIMMERHFHIIYSIHLDVCWVDQSTSLTLSDIHLGGHVHL